MIKASIGVFAIVSLMLGAALSMDDPIRWFGSAAASPTDSANVGDYLTTEVEVGRIRRTISATGALQAVSTVEVSSQLSGQIARLHVDFNDSVTAGQPLAELDQRGFRARVAEADAAAEMANENVAIRAAQLDKASGMEMEAVAQRKIFAARIDQARVMLEAAERQLARTKTLAKRGTVASTTLEDALSTRDTAAAELREAEAVAAAHEHAVASSQAARREAAAELANARAALPLQTAALEISQHDLERSTIRAPIDGLVVGRNVEQGQTVAVSLDAPVLFTIAGDLSRMEIHANIDETDIGEIAVGQAAEFTVDAYPGRTFAARVSEIRKAARVVQGVVIYTVVLDVSNSDGLLLPGMTSTVRIVVEEVGPIATVPLSALRFAPDGRDAVTGDPGLADDGLGNQVVWVLGAAGTPQSRNVHLGVDDGRDVAVLGGTLSERERVITGRVPSSTSRGLFGIQF